VKRFLKWTAVGVALLALLAGGLVAYVLADRPDMSAMRSLFQPSASRTAQGVRVTYLGVATLLVDDGETALMTDGFFSRPGIVEVAFGRVAPDPAVIARSLARVGVRRLAAVIPVHSHYDHAMDSPEVARLTGALLVGSESTANVGRGWNLPENQIRVVAHGEAMTFGRFRVTFLASRHVPTLFTGGTIDAPLRPPVRASAYREGTSWVLLVEHDGRSLVIAGSAGFVPGLLAGRRAETVFLGVGGLGQQDQAYMGRYWDEIVGTVGATRVFPIHWDDFTKPLDEPFQPLPRRLDGFDASMRFLLERARATTTELRLIDAFATVDPFAPPALQR
jgi:L-ascorbate metabolism protein UlaG (beta-lactamase superfamily)